jgi:SPP1 gp7 family putative phage head morphogenesis protein
MYRFKGYTIPIEIKNFFRKESGIAPQQVIDVVTNVDAEPFVNDLKESTNTSYRAGGQSALAIFDVTDDFKIIEENNAKWLASFESNIGTAYTQQVATKARFELLEGMRNLESVPQIKKRLETVWDEAIDVIVPPKLDSTGKVIRAGYSYTVSSEEWATIVARTEVSRAFAMGRLEAFTQSGVVDKVQWLVAADERLCPLCSVMEGEVFKLQEAMTLIPLHPQCRCSWVPVLTNYATAQEQAKANLAAIYDVAA